MPSNKAVAELKELYSKTYGVLLSDAQASQLYGKFIGLYKAIYEDVVSENNPSDRER